MNDTKHANRDERASLRTVLRANASSIAGLSVTSLAGGLLEAGFLVIVTKLAFALTEEERQVELLADVSLTLTLALTLALIVVLLRISAAIASAWQSARLSSDLVASIRRQLASSFLRASWAAQHDSRNGRLQELLTTYAQQGSVLGVSLGTVVISGFSLIALLSTAIAVEPIASVVLIGGVFLLASILRPIRSAIRKQARSTASTGMDFATSLNEVSQLGMEMHVFGVQKQTEQRVYRLIAENESTSRRLRFLQGLLPAMYTGLAYIAVLSALGIIASMGSTDLRSIGAVLIIMLRSFSYGQGLQSGVASVSSTVPFLTSLDRELTRYRDAERPTGHKTVGSAHSVNIERLHFAYDLSVPVLKDVSFTIEPHEILGVIGPSGGGKSTLVQLLLGLRIPNSGSLKVDGQDLQTLKRSQWVRKATFVPQDSHLIEGSVAENIRFLRDWVSFEDIKAAAELANLAEDIEKWDDGYERQVGSGGSYLSGGQKQRLTIARALVEQPDLLILDEPTSSLDVRSETLIRSTLDNLRQQTTIVIVAHRLSTLAICDRLVVVQDGILEDIGTPLELETSSDFYRTALELPGLE